MAQTRQRVAGVTPDGATRRVSLHDADARPIAKGRLGRPVEFGQKAQVVDNDDGIVLDHSVEQGNPPDAPQLAPAVARVKKRAGRAPRTVTADRGYGEASVDKQLTDLGVTNVVIPRKGKPSPARRPKSIEKRSAAPSNGEPAAKAGSATSNAATAGTAPASTAPKAPGSGPDTASSPTTSSRSAPSPRDRMSRGPVSAQRGNGLIRQPEATQPPPTFSGRSN